MVMERIHGVPISDMARCAAAAPTSRGSPRTACEIFFTQVFRHNFFHADMHPGNIFVIVDDPEHPRYAAVDFGIVGTLDPRDQYYLAENFLAFFERDYHRVAQLHVDSGWVPAGNARRRAGVRGAHGLRADLQQAAQGDLVRAGAAATVRDRAALQHAHPAAADPAAEDAAEYRGAGRDSSTRSWTSGRPRDRSCASGCASARACAPSCDGLRTHAPELLGAARELPGLLRRMHPRPGGSRLTGRGGAGDQPVARRAAHAGPAQ